MMHNLISYYLLTELRHAFPLVEGSRARIALWSGS
jgi:hypothetical protein